MSKRTPLASLVGLTSYWVFGGASRLMVRSGRILRMTARQIAGSLMTLLKTKSFSKPALAQARAAHSIRFILITPPI